MNVGVRPKVDTAMVVGATSMVGWAMVQAANTLGVDVQPVCNRHNRSPRTREWLRLNVDEPHAWDVLRTSPPDLLVYCGGICDVDRCEVHPEFAQAVNVDGVAAMLEALCTDTRLVYCSSDHVFGGDQGPYTELSIPHPISVYGRTRVQAEALVARARPDALIVRLGLAIGPSLCGRRGHLDWLRYRHAKGLPMTVIADERRSAVWADAAARAIFRLVHHGVSGLRHITAHRACSRPELAHALCQHLGLEARYDIRLRRDLDVPHLGNVELATIHKDDLSTPLSAVVETLAPCTSR